MYWLAIYVVSHTPVDPTLVADSGDKVLHFCGYAGFALLLSMWRTTESGWNFRQAALVLLITVTYGAFDELTQPLFGRFCDSDDWIADQVGALTAVALYSGWRHFWTRRTAAPEATESASSGFNAQRNLETV